MGSSRTLMTIAAGSRLGPYEVLSPLGAGGMGEVYRARDTRLGREVAVKVLPSAFSADPDRLRRFEQEARAASALNHPNILAIYDVGTHQEAPYVVSELLEGETLRERLAGAALSARKAVDHGIQIAEGLAAAHEKGIVHRDLKPENLFVTNDGRVKVLDFGLAKLTRPETGSVPMTEVPTLTAGTEPGVVMGTVGYMSPEQVRGQRADHRSDIFTFGAILYETLTGKLAFRGDSAVEAMNAILKEEPPELSKPSQEVSPSLQRIVRRCLEKSPQERFQSARDLAFALREAASGSAAAPAAVALPAARSRSILWFASLGISLAVLLAMLIAFNVGGLKQRLLGGAEPGRIESIAVLPLQNLSGDPEQEFFADGMTDALISNLAQIGALKVISRTSVMRYKSHKKSLPEIARELHVEGIVEGSVLRAGDRVRITAQLVHAPTDQHIWAQSYERDSRDVLALQGEVARAIAREINARATTEEQARLTRVRSVDPEAHEAYLRGRFYWNKRTIDAMKKGLEYFQAAIEKDPKYAPAHAGLADSYAMLGAYGGLPPGVAFPAAKAAAQKALEIQDLAEAHASLLAVYLDYDWDWPAVEREFQRAVAVNPNYVTAHHWYAMYLAAVDHREEALNEIRRAHELDPLAPVVQTHVGVVRYLGRDFHGAIGEYRTALEFDPNYVPAYRFIGEAYEQIGMHSEAVNAAQQAVTLSRSDPKLVACLARAHAVAGENEQARRILQELDELSKSRYVSALDIAHVYAWLGEKEKALDWLDKAYAERSWGMYRLKVDPKVDPLRSEPRFQQILERMKFPS